MSKHGKIIMNKLSKQANPKKAKSNSTNMFRPLHSFLVRKLNQKEKTSYIINKEIDECLNLPEKFFSPNSKVTIGKKIKLKNMKIIGLEKPALKKSTFQCKRMSLYRKSFNFSNNLNIGETNLRHSISSTFFSNKEKLQQQVNNDKYEVINNEQLKKIFNKYKTCKNNSLDNNKKIFFKKINGKIDNNNTLNDNINNNNNSSININKSKMSRNKEMPLDIAQSLIFQNNKLNIRNNLDNKIKNISRNISKLLNKDEKELLINKVDDFTFKKELLNEIDFNKPIDEKYGVYKWNISLRRPKNFEGQRNTYINLTRDQNPFWGIVVEKNPKIKEYKIKPGCLKKNKAFFEKFKKTHFPLVNPKDYKNLENLDELYIKGENLYNIEYDREINNNKGKKLLHKTFVDKNGKVILKTEINNVFGEMTFYENYNNNLFSTKNSYLTNNNSIYNTFISRLSSNLKNFSKSAISFKEIPNSFIKNDDYKKRTFYKNNSLPVL